MYSNVPVPPTDFKLPMDARHERKLDVFLVYVLEDFWCYRKGLNSFRVRSPSGLPVNVLQQVCGCHVSKIRAVRMTPYRLCRHEVHLGVRISINLALYLISLSILSLLFFS